MAACGLLGLAPSEALDRLTGADWSLLAHAYERHPFDSRQDDLRAGVVASVAAAAWGGSVAPHDLFPNLSPPRRAGDTQTAFAALCPALTVTEA